jgi:hypothetical protein
MADTNLPTFAQGAMPSFTPPAEDQDSASSILRGALGDQFSGIGNLMDKKAKADEKVMRLEQEQKKSELERKAKDYGTYVKGIKSQYEQAKPALMAAPPKFNVTKDTQEGLTGLAALMTVGSLIIGSKGASSGVNAMNAMTGVLKGYQEGNQQRIDFETKKYEQSVKDWERTLQQTKDALSRYEKMASLDLNKATAEAAAYAASQGQDVIAAKIRSGTIGDAIKMVQNLQQQTNTSKLVSVIDKDTNQQTYATEAQIRQNPDRYQAAPTGRATAQPGATSEAVSTNAQAIANYSIAPPGRNNRNRDQIMAQVMVINPEYKEGDYGNQNIALRNWTNPNGAGFKQIGAFSTVSGHLETLNKLATALDNGDTPTINAMVNYIKRQTGDATVTNYDTAKQAVAGELVKAVTGVAGALYDREEAAANLLRNGSPEQQEQAIETWKQLIASRLETSMYQFKSGTGRSENDFLQLLPPATREYFSGYAGVRPAARTETPRAPSAASGTTPSTAQPAYLNGREIIVKNGRWVFKDTGEEAR